MCRYGLWFERGDQDYWCFHHDEPLDLNRRMAGEKEKSAISQSPESQRQDIPFAHKYILDNISFSDNRRRHLEVLVNLG